MELILNEIFVIFFGIQIQNYLNISYIRFKYLKKYLWYDKFTHIISKF